MWRILLLKLTRLTYLFSQYCPKITCQGPNINQLFSPGSSAGKEFTCNAGDPGLIPGLGRSAGEGKGYPLQCSGLQNSVDYIVCGVAKSWTWLRSFHFIFTCFIFYIFFTLFQLISGDVCLHIQHGYVEGNIHGCVYIKVATAVFSLCPHGNFKRST